MKLTREQVSQLSDVELNRAMIWCYPTNYIISADTGVFITKKQLFTDFHTCVDYLTDYNLTMPLAIEHALALSISPSCERNAIVFAGDFMAHDGNPLRAICEVLVMIAMEAEL